MAANKEAVIAKLKEAFTLLEESGYMLFIDAGIGDFFYINSYEHGNGLHIYESADGKPYLDFNGYLQLKTKEEYEQYFKENSEEE